MAETIEAKHERERIIAIIDKEIVAIDRTKYRSWEHQNILVQKSVLLRSLKLRIEQKGENQ